MRSIEHWVRILAAACALAGTTAMAAGADAGAGGRIAASGIAGGAPACAGCHGAKGEGMGAFPHLAGTGVDYLREQLEAFASGARKNAVMQPIAAALDAQQRQDVAAYYASLTGRAGKAGKAVAADATPRSPTERGAWLATRGRWADELPACSQCHGPGGVGVGTQFPPLAGQPSEYIAAQLKAWKEGSRPAGPLGLMQVVARKLDDADVRAVSDYYATLGTSNAVATSAPAASAASAVKGKQ